ncbi:hypothetical protein ACH4E7_32790 [Kitasatospora sp. NPDC018058]|uniref:hypothetical protein n=1 Tax=Kitasatospora sp. NPDC018058 TaxID=3364025 RepID=UPI0037C098E3
MERLVANLLDLSRLRAGEIPVVLRPTVLRPVVAAALSGEDGRSARSAPAGVLGRANASSSRLLSYEPALA